MPPKRSSKRRPARRNRARKPRRQRRRKPSSSGVAYGNLGRLIVTGIRNVIPYLPGAPIISTIADFALRMFGVTSSEVNDGKFSGNVSVTGAGSKFLVNYVNVITGSTAGFRTQTGTKVGRPAIQLDYHQARLVSLSVSIVPVGPIGKRAGEWTLGVSPISSQNEENDIKANVDVPNIVEVQRMLHTITGPASKTLALTIRPTIHDGRAFLFNALETSVVCVALRYDCPSRDSYVNFNAEEIAFNCMLKGTVELRSPPTSIPSGSVNPDTHEDKVLDCLKASITIQNTKGVFSVTSDAAIVANNEKSVTVRGDLVKPKTKDVLSGAFDEFMIVQ